MIPLLSFSFYLLSFYASSSDSVGNLSYSPFKSIPSKNHQPNGYWCEDGDDNDPYYWIMNIFRSFRIDMCKGTAYKKIDNCRRQQQPDYAKKSFKSVHIIRLIVNVTVNFIGQVYTSDHQAKRGNTDRVPKTHQVIGCISCCK